MERRTRIVLRGLPAQGQLELETPKVATVTRRPRVTFLEDPLQRQPGETLNSVVARRTAVGKKDKPLTVNVEAFLGYSAWSVAEPECCGWWEVKQKSARDTKSPLRLWYDHGGQEWSNPNAEARVRPMPHAEFVKSHEWRGLRSAHPDGYEYLLVGRVSAGITP